MISSWLRVRVILWISLRINIKILGRCLFFLQIYHHLYSRGKVAVLDNGFCVTQGIIEIRKLGIFQVIFIKKRCYWPSQVPGDAIYYNSSTNYVCDTDILKGKIYNHHCKNFCLKYTNYIMIIMSTYYVLIEYPIQKAPMCYLTSTKDESKTAQLK